jgi:hypothetical protein
VVVDCKAGWQLGATVRDEFLAGGRVGGDSGQLLELWRRTREVRAAPNRARVADRRVSPWGQGNGDGGGQKCDDDCGGSVASVDERREKEGSV